ncbi:hypothetical protein RQP46_004132 [Phenoliferia psychrophenolica]
MATHFIEMRDRFTSFIFHKDFHEPVLLRAIVNALEAYSHESKARTHAFVLTFAVDGTADPLDPVSCFVLEGAKVIPFAQVSRRYTHQCCTAAEEQESIASVKQPTPPDGGTYMFYVAELKLEERIGLQGAGFSATVGWRNVGWSDDLIEKDWLVKLEAGVAKLREDHILMRQTRLDAFRKTEWAHCRHCHEDNALKPDICAALYTIYKILTPHPLIHTHILTITVRRLPSITDPSLTFEVVNISLLALDEISSEGPLSPFETSIGYSLEETVQLLTKNAKDHPKLGRHQAHVVMFDETSSILFSLPLSLMDVSTVASFNVDNQSRRKMQFGILGDTEDWEEMLRTRAKVSAVGIKEGVAPEMSPREYERWKEGFIA